MKIWIINHYAIPPSLGGLVRHYYFSKYLTRMGHDVRIFTSSEIHNTTVNKITDASLYREVEEDGVVYTYLRTSDYSGNGLGRIRNMLEFPVRIWQAARHFEKPDVIYTSSPSIFAAASAQLLAKKLRVPCVTEVRDIWPESIVEYKGFSRKNPIILVLYGLEKWLYKKADRLIFTMEGGPDYIREKHWEKAIPLEKIRNLNNGVDLEEFDHNAAACTLDDPDLLDKEHFKVVYTGSIRLVNNLSKVVEMARWLQEQGEERVKFLIYGDGTERAALEQQAKDWGLRNIVFKGKVEKRFVPFILTHSDLNLNHVKQTGIMRFGCSLNKLFDYFASGRPLLSDLTVSHDLITRYQAGVTLPTQDTEALCREVLRFAQMPQEEYDGYCRRARQAAEDYDYQALSRRLLEILQEAAGERRS